MVLGCSTSVYSKSNGSFACGIYLNTNLTFHLADLKCSQLGAQLPEIRNLTENQDILDRRVSLS